MKPSASIIFVIALAAALAGGLAWKFWPAVAATPSSSPPPSAPVPIPATVQPPAQPPAQPAAAASTNPPPDRAAISTAGGSLDPVSVTYNNNHANLDFGRVVLTPGVPVPLNFPTGQTATITASVLADGRMQVDVDIQRAASAGSGLLSHGVFFGDAPGPTPVRLETADFTLVFSAQLSGK